MDSREEIISCPENSPFQALRVTLFREHEGAPCAAYYWGGNERPELCVHMLVTQALAVCFETNDQHRILPDSTLDVVVIDTTERGWERETRPLLESLHHIAQARNRGDWHVLCIANRATFHGRMADVLIEGLAQEFDATLEWERNRTVPARVV